MVRLAAALLVAMASPSSSAWLRHSRALSVPEGVAKGLERTGSQAEEAKDKAEGSMPPTFRQISMEGPCGPECSVASNSVVSVLGMSGD